MGSKYNYKDLINDVFTDEFCVPIWDGAYKVRKNKSWDDYVLNEQDFYPPPDRRVFTSLIEDIEDGDNFEDCCKYIFDLYEEEDYFEN